VMLHGGAFALRVESTRRALRVSHCRRALGLRMKCLGMLYFRALLRLRMILRGRLALRMVRLSAVGRR
jgi:hypothetical protein